MACPRRRVLDHKTARKMPCTRVQMGSVTRDSTLDTGREAGAARLVVHMKHVVLILGLQSSLPRSPHQSALVKR